MSKQDYTAKFNENADDYIGTMKRIFNGVGDQNGIDDPDFLRTQLSNGKALIAELEKNPNGFDKDYIERSIASIQNSNNLIRERLMILQLAGSPNPEVSSKAREIIEKYANYDPMSNVDETTGKLKSKYEPANADWVLKTVAGTAPQGNRGTSSVISSVLESSTMSPKDKYNAILKSYQTDWTSFEKVPKETGLDSYLTWQDETYKLLGEDYAASAEYIQNFADQLIEEYGVDSDSEEIRQLRGIAKSYESMAKSATLDDFFNGFADEHEFNQWYLAEAAKGNNRDNFVGFDADKVRDSITDIENRIAVKQQELNEVRSSSKGFGKSGMESVPKIQELESELLTLKDRRDDYNKIVSAYETAKELDSAIDSGWQYQQDVNAKTDELIKLEDAAAKSKADFDKARMITREGLTAQEFLELEQKAADDAAAVETARKELSHMHEMQALATSGLSRDAAVLSTLSTWTDNRTFGQQAADWTKATKADLKAALADGTLSWKDLGTVAKNAAANAYNIADLRLVQTMDFLVGEDSPLTGHGTAIGKLRQLGSTALKGLGVETRFADDDRIGYFAEQVQKDQAAIEQNRKNIENAVSNNKTVADIANLLSDTFSCAFDLIPMTVMAVATGGASAAPTLAAGTTEYLTYVSSINTGSELSRMATIMTQDLAATAKNPMYWTSFASVAGPSYQDALDQGLSKDVATTYALINSAINAKIEIGGGLETFPERIRDGVYKTDKGFWAASLDAVKELFTESGFDEAKEELWQGMAERALMAAAKGDNLTWTDTGEEHTTALFSTTAQDAVINPKLMAKEAGAGYLGGVLLGGGQQILNSSVQAVSEAKLNNRFAREYNTIEKQQQFIADSKYLGNTSEKVMAADAQLNPKEGTATAKQLSGKELLAIARENEKASGEAKVGLAAKRMGLSTEDIETIKRDFANSDARETNKFIKGMADIYRWATLDGEIESASRYLPDTDYLSNEAKSHIYNMGQKVGNPDLNLTKTETFTVGNITGTITGLKTVGNELRVQLTDAEGNVREVAVSGETMPQLPKAIQDLWKEFGDKAGMLYEAYDPSISFRQYRNDVRALMSAASNSTQSWAEFSQTEGAAKLAPSLTPELKQQLWDSVPKTNRHTAVVKSQITRAKNAADRTVNEVTPGEVKGKKFSVTLKNANGKNVNIDLAEYKVTKAEKGSKEARALKVAEAAAKVFGINIYLYDAPNTGIAGAFVGEDTIYLNMQDADAKGDYIIMKSLSHELTHFIQKNSARDYQALKSFMVDKLLQKQKGMTYEQLLQDKITRENLTGPDAIARAEDEIVADGCEMMLKNSKVFEELATQNLSLGKRIQKWLNNVKRALQELYGDQSATFEEAEYMKQFIDEQQKLWDRGLKNAVLNRDAQRKAEAKKNNASAFQAAPTSAHAGAHVPTGVSPDSMKNAAVNAESSSEIFNADATVVFDGEPTFSFVALGEASGFNAFRNADGERFFMRDGKVVTEVTTKDIEKSAIGALVRASNLSVEDAQKEIEFFARICNMAIQNRDFGMTMKFVGSTVFTAMKQNSDAQYGTTYDFPSICTKTQAIINAMSAAMVARKRGLSKMEVLDLYRDAFEMKNAVPCPECYVFTHWIGIGGLLDNIYKYQTKYCAPERTAQDVWAEYKTIADKILQEGEGKTFSKRKADLKDKAQKHVDQLIKWRDEGSPPRGHKKNEAFTAKQQSELQKWQNEVDQYNAMTWLTDVYFAGSPLSGWVFDKKMTAATLQKNLDSIDPTTLSMNPRAAVDPDILFDLNRGDDFALDYPEAWDFRTTQGNGYGKAITPYADTVLGEGIMITNNDDFIAQKKEFARVNPRGSRMRNPFLDLGIDGQLTEKAQNILDGARKKMKAQNFLGGQRFSSTSDARPDTLSDFLLAVLEVQAMGGKVQVYTKVTGAVDAYCGWGFSVNMSMMPRFGGLDANGFLQDTAVGGVNPFTAQMMRTKEGNDSAGTITIGVNDNHIRALMNDQQGRIFDKLTGKWRTYTLGRDFIIPYHASGGDATIVDTMRRIQEGEETTDSGRKIQSSDYTKTQEDKILSDEMLKAVSEELWGRKLTDEDIELIHARRAARKAIMSGRGNVDMDVVNGSRFLTALYNKFKVEGGEWYEVTIAGSKFESKIFPNEFWDKTVTYDNSSKITQDYLDYCEELGFLHRFSGRIVDEKAKALVRISGYDQFGNQTKLTDLAHKVDENGNETNEIEPFFWKTLTDRRMYDNEGNYLEQKYVTLTHSEVVEPTEKKPGGSFAYAFDGSREFNQELSRKQVEQIRAAENESKKFSLINDAYNEARANNDKRMMRTIIREAAQARGFTEHVYHGSTMFGDHTVLKTTNVESATDGGTYAWSPYFATDDPRIAQSYAAGALYPTPIYKANNPRLDNAFDSWDDAIQDSDILTEESRKALRNIIADYRKQIETVVIPAIKDVAIREADNDPWNRTKLYHMDEYSELMDYDSAFTELAEKYNITGEDLDKYVELISTGNEALYNIMDFMLAGDALYDNNGHEINGGTYEYYANTKDFYEMDAKGARWDKLFYEGENVPTNTRGIAERALKAGHKGVIIRNVYDNGGRGRGTVPRGTVYIFFDPEHQLKSADLETYDDNGNIIMPDERFDTEHEDIRYSFVRPSDDLIQQAEALEAQGKDEFAIWGELGLIKGPDGKWRTELDDSRIRFYKNGNAKSSGHGHMLDDYLEFPELYEQYPALKNIGVTENPEAPNIRTSFDPVTGTININPNAHMPKEVKRLAVLHEVQHMIQRLEGWAAEEYGYGEQEAKLVEARHNLSKAQRRAMLPKLLSTIDKTYMPMAKSGQEKAAQQLVDDAAHAAGYTEKVYHGSVHFGDHTVLETSGIDSTSDGGTYEWSPYFATDKLEIAKTYSGRDEARQIGKTSHKGNKTPKAELKSRATLLTTDLFTAIHNRFPNLPDSELEAIQNYCDVLEYDLEDYIDDYMDGSTFQHHLNNISSKIFIALNDNKTVVQEEGLNWFLSEAWIDAQTAISGIINDAKDANTHDRYGNYQYWVNTENFLVVEADFHKWHDLTYPSTGETGLTTREIAKQARDDGYSGVKILNVYDIGPQSGSGPAGTVYIFFDPQTQVKSADPITYDDEGEIIPLSERFSPDNPDIRFSLMRRFPNERSFLDAYNNRLDEEFEGYVLSPAQERMVIPKIENDAQADYYNNLPKYAEDIAAGMIPFVPGDAIPDYDRSLIKYSSEWYKKNGLPIPAKRTPYALFEPTLVDDGSVVERDELPFSIVPQHERTMAEQLAMDQRADAAQQAYFRDNPRIPDINRKVRPTLRTETINESTATDATSESPAGPAPTDMATPADVSTPAPTGAHTGARVSETPTTGPQKQSKFASNTLEGMDIWDEIGGRENTMDRNGEFLYNEVTERESIDAARQRLEADWGYWERDLMGEYTSPTADREWTGKDLDTAMAIFRQKRIDANRNQDQSLTPEERYADVDAWLQRIREKATAGGQLIQAFAKYSRTPEGVLIQAGRDLAANSKLTRDQRNEILNKMINFAMTLDALKEAGDTGDNSSLIELIKQQAEMRGTPVSQRIENGLKKEQFQYLYDVALTQLAQIAADYRPNSIGKKLSTYQTIAHLLNLRTGTRNVVANMAFRTVDRIANMIAAPMDALVGKITGNRTVGWKQLGRLSSEVRESEHERGRRASIEASLDVDPYNGKDKYGTSRRTWKMKDGPGARVMSTLEKWMAYELNVTDEISKGIILGEVMESLSPFIENNLLSEKEAIAMAKQEMLYRTFQDDNWANGLLGAIKNALNVIGTGSTNGKMIGSLPVHDFGLGDIVTKYVQVPGSLIMRMIEYSPVGTIKAVADMANIFTAYNQLSRSNTLEGAKQAVADLRQQLAEAKAAGADTTELKAQLKEATSNYKDVKSRTGDIRAKAFLKDQGQYTKTKVAINNEQARMNALQAQRRAMLQLGRSLTGSGLIALFAALAKAGLLRRDDDDEDKDIRALNTSAGLSGTQLNLSALMRAASGETNWSEWLDGDKLMDIGFLEPLNGLMTIGAIVAKNNDNLISRDTMNDTLAGLMENIAELPVMQTLGTIQSSIQNLQYDAESENATQSIAKDVMSVAIDVARSSASGFIPAPVRQAAQATDEYARDMYQGDTGAEKFVDSLKSSIPGLRQTLPQKLDNFGNPRTTEIDPFTRAMNAFINPGNLRTYRSADLTNELNRLYDATGKSGILPKRYAPYSINEGPGYQLTADEKRVYQITRGQTADNLLRDLFESQAYQTATDEQRAEWAKNVVSYADYVAKQEFLNNRNYLDEKGEGYSSRAKEEMKEALAKGVPLDTYLKYVDAIDRRYTVATYDYEARNETLEAEYRAGNINDEQFIQLYDYTTNSTDTTPEKLTAASEAGIAPPDYLVYKAEINNNPDFSRTKANYGKGYDTANKKAVSAYIWSVAKTDEQAKILWLLRYKESTLNKLYQYKPKS